MSGRGEVQEEEETKEGEGYLEVILFQLFPPLLVECFLCLNPLLLLGLQPADTVCHHNDIVIMTPYDITMTSQ